MTPTTEFSRIVKIEPWPAEGVAVDVVATSVECQGLKERFDLVGMESLKASGRIERDGNALVFQGALEAEVTQRCVVSLAPVPSTIKMSFERRYVRGDIDVSTLGLDESNLEGSDADVDVLDADHVDVGEVIAEEFYLALNSYPRAEDADVVMAEVQGFLDQDDMSLPDSPFAKLRRH